MQVDTKNKRLSIQVPEGRGEIYAMRKGEESGANISSMQILPNPVRFVATLVMQSVKEETTIIHVIDNSGTVVIGQRMQLKKGVNYINLNISALASGQYIISSTAQDVKTLKMIKQ